MFGIEAAYWLSESSSIWEGLGKNQENGPLTGLETTKFWEKQLDQEEI